VTKTINAMFRVCAKCAIFIALVALVSSCRKGNSEAPGSTSTNTHTATQKAGQSSAADVLTASGIEMVYVPGGEFTMGNSQGNPDEGPTHKVTLTGFLIDKYEVTQEMFAKVQLPNPSRWNDNPKKPVERVRWRDARQYCIERSLLEGLKSCYNETNSHCDFSANGYRLPTEAEWEFASRAGSADPYEFGSKDKLRQYAWFSENADEKTHLVGQKKPNRWGIHDLYGNVSEWCEDVYSPDFYKSTASSDPAGPPSPGTDVKRVLRGGSWKSSAEMCRVSYRQGERTGDTDACFCTDNCGFRCVRRAPLSELEKLKTAPK